MKITSVLKAGLLAVAIALPVSFSVAEAKKAPPPPPPGSCALDKGYMTSGSICSYSCDAATNWCPQQMCVNGFKTPVLPCYGSFCAPKCGG
jgi:hypothetical protein